MCPPRVCFPSPVDVLAALWCVNGELLQEGLRHTQVYCTQSPCSCSSPLLTRMSSGHTQTLFCLSLCVALGSGVHKVHFSPLECLWQVWGLILNVIVPLIPSFWGFSFAPGCGISPQSHSSMTQLLLQHMRETSVSQFSHSVVSDSLQLHGLQHTSPPCPSPIPGVYSNSCPLSW